MSVTDGESWTKSTLSEIRAAFEYISEISRTPWKPGATALFGEDEIPSMEYFEELLHDSEAVTVTTKHGMVIVIVSPSKWKRTFCQTMADIRIIPNPKVDIVNKYRALVEVAVITARNIGYDSILIDQFTVNTKLITVLMEDDTFKQIGTAQNHGKVPGLGWTSSILYYKTTGLRKPGSLPKPSLVHGDMFDVNTKISTCYPSNMKIESLPLTKTLTNGLKVRFDYAKSKHYAEMLKCIYESAETGDGGYCYDELIRVPLEKPLLSAKDRCVFCCATNADTDELYGWFWIGPDPTSRSSQPIGSDVMAVIKKEHRNHQINLESMLLSRKIMLELGYCGICNTIMWPTYATLALPTKTLLDMNPTVIVPHAGYMVKYGWSAAAFCYASLSPVHKGLLSLSKV